MAYPNLSDREKKSKNTNKSVVSGKFLAKQPQYEKPAIFKINTVLALALLTVIVLSMISYFVVVAKENRVKELHFVTNKMNYENIELQNKVDYLKSFYALDTKVQKMDFLRKPDKVIEVNSTGKKHVFLQEKPRFDVTSVPGF